jgi:hypothetical protein
MVMKPLLELIVLILHLTDVNVDDWWVTLRILVALTSLIGFGTLFFIYFRIRNIISDFQPGRKFLALKICVFTPIFQTFVFDIITNWGLLDPDEAILMDNALLLVWMLPIAIFLFDTFLLRDLTEEYITDYNTEPVVELEETEPLMKAWVVL